MTSLEAIFTQSSLTLNNFSDHTAEEIAIELERTIYTLFFSQHTNLPTLMVACWQLQDVVRKDLEDSGESDLEVISHFRQLVARAAKRRLKILSTQTTKQP